MLPTKSCPFFWAYLSEKSAFRTIPVVDQLGWAPGRRSHVFSASASSSGHSTVRPRPRNDSDLGLSLYACRSRPANGYMLNRGENPSLEYNG
jgi:hypothetical protein